MSIKEQIDKDVKNNKVILYMKGTPEMPQCGFSAQAVTLLKQCNVPFVTRNVLDNDELRSAIKEYSDWPTIPQLYVNGEFVGGCDIMMELGQSGELVKLLSKE